MILPQGIQDANFYELIKYALLQKGYNSIADFIREAPNYWYDEQVWKELFPMEDYENPTRAFEQRIGDAYVPVMAVYLSDEAETPLITNSGAEKRTGEIPRMGHGFLFSSKSYEDARKLIRVSANAVADKVYDAFSLDLMKLIQGIHAKRTYTALQVESQGFYHATKENNSGGIDNLRIDMNPVAAKGAGGYGSRGAKVAYSDDAANPLGDLQDMFEYGWRNKLLSPDYTKSVTRMSDTQWEAIKNHPSVRLSVAQWKTGYLAAVDNLAAVNLTDEDLARYMTSLRIPAVSVSREYGFREKLNLDTQTIEKVGSPAFAENTIVMRPAGAVGTTQWSKVSNIFSTNDVPMYYTEGGAIAIQEDTNARGQGKKFSVESLCVPVPTATERILRLKTDEAAK